MINNKTMMQIRQRPDNMENNGLRHLSNQENKRVNQACDTLHDIHENCCDGRHIHHYCCFVVHGRTKSSREICRNWEEQLDPTIQCSHASRRDRCIFKAPAILLQI